MQFGSLWIHHRWWPSAPRFWIGSFFIHLKEKVVGWGVGDKCVMSVLHKKVRKGVSLAVAAGNSWRIYDLGCRPETRQFNNSTLSELIFWKPSLGSRSASSFFTLDSFDTLLHQRVCETVVGQNICPGAERWPNRLPQRTASAHIHTISFMYQMDWERGSRVRQRSGREKKSVSLLPYTIAVCAGRGCRGPLASIIGFSFRTFFPPVFQSAGDSLIYFT